MLNKIPLMGRYDPQWTEREYTRGGSRDDLGIETLSEAILADLLPGINTTSVAPSPGPA